VVGDLSLAEFRAAQLRANPWSQHRAPVWLEIQ
jgi:hypothetical protein